jgi:hypothetical protein
MPLKKLFEDIHSVPAPSRATTKDNIEAKLKGPSLTL